MGTSREPGLLLQKNSPPRKRLYTVTSRYNHKREAFLTLPPRSKTAVGMPHFFHVAELGEFFKIILILDLHLYSTCCTWQRTRLNSTAIQCNYQTSPENLQASIFHTAIQCNYQASPHTYRHRYASSLQGMLVASYIGSVLLKVMFIFITSYRRLEALD